MKKAPEPSEMAGLVEGQVEALKRVVVEYLQTPYEFFKGSYRVNRKQWENKVVALSFLQQRLLNHKCFRWSPGGLKDAIKECGFLKDMGYVGVMAFDTRAQIYKIGLEVQCLSPSYQFKPEDFVLWARALSYSIDYTEVAE
jgi:hypothetical protein